MRWVEPWEASEMQVPSEADRIGSARAEWTAGPRAQRPCHPCPQRPSLSRPVLWLIMGVNICSLGSPGHSPSPSLCTHTETLGQGVTLKPRGSP